MSSWVDLVHILMSTPYDKTGRMGLPVILWGRPGIGKSQRIYQLAERCGAHCETVISSIHDPTDFSGLPIITEGDSASNVSGPGCDVYGIFRAPPQWAVRANQAAEDGKDVIIFLDEISCSPPAVQAALLRVILDRVVGEMALHPNVRLVAAANEAENAAGGWELAPPLANRFLHLEVKEPSFEDWSEWLMSHDKQEVDESDRIRQTLQFDETLWQSAFDAARSEILGFLQARRDLLFDLPKQEKDRGKAWPSPRSWAMATRALSAAKCRRIQDRGVLLRLMIGAVGLGAARSLMEFLKELDLPNPEDVIHGRTTITPNKARPDRVYAALNSVTAYVNSIEQKEKRHKAVKVLTRIAIDIADKGQGEVATLALRPIRKDLQELIKADKEVFEMITGSKFEKIVLSS